MTAASRAVLVTGASGFAGRHVLRAFRDRGWTAHGTSRTRGRKSYHPLSLDDPAEIRRVLAAVRPDIVVHLAGVAHRRASQDEYERVNHRGTVLLACALAELRPGATFVYASSATVYGNGPFAAPLTESAPESPCDPYAASKLAGERAALAHVPQLRVIAFRFPALYAADWLFNVRKRAYAPGPFGWLPIRLLGGRPRYSFCAIENAVSAILHAATGGMKSGTYNIADHAPYTQEEVLRVVRQCEGTEARLPLLIPVRAVHPLYWALTFCFPEPQRRSMRGAYFKLVDGMVLDCSRAHDAGYTPTVTLADAHRNSLSL